MSATATAPMISLHMSTAKLSSPLCTITERTKIKSVTPVPSLNRDSFSMTEQTFLDKPILFRIPVAAIGSVGLTTQPSRIHIQMSIGILKRLAMAKIKMPYIKEETAVVRNASRQIGRRFCLNLPILTLLAPAKSMKQSTPSIKYFSKPNSPIPAIKRSRTGT